MYTAVLSFTHNQSTLSIYQIYIAECLRIVREQAIKVGHDFFAGLAFFLIWLNGPNCRMT